MKPVPCAFILLFAAAGGAYVHHVAAGQNELPRRQSTAGDATRPQPEPGRSSPAIARLTDELIAAGGSSGGPIDRVLTGERLSAMKASDFPLLYRDLIGRGDGVMKRNQRLVEALLEYWAAADAAGLLAFAEKGSAGLTLRSVADYCMWYVPDAVVDAILRMPPSGGKGAEVPGLLELAFGGLSRHRPVTALQLAERHGILQQHEMPWPLVGAMSQWARQDATAAITFAERHPAFLKTAVSAWMANAPEAALAFMGQKPEATLDKRWIDGALQEYLQKHPDETERVAPLFGGREPLFIIASKPVAEAAAWVRTLPEEERVFGYTGIIESLTKRDPAAAASFCALMPELAAHASTDHAIRAWSARDPAAAARLLQSGALPDAVRERTLPETVESWIGRDRTAAMEFIAAQPPCELTGRLMLDASRILTDGNTDSARDFALTLPDPALQRGACRRILYSEFPTSSADPGQTKAAAAQWVAGIPDPGLRKVLKADIVSRWPAPPPPKPPKSEPDGADPFASP